MKIIYRHLPLAVGKAAFCLWRDQNSGIVRLLEISGKVEICILMALNANLAAQVLCKDSPQESRKEPQKGGVCTRLNPAEGWSWGQQRNELQPGFGWELTPSLPVCLQCLNLLLLTQTHIIFLVLCWSYLILKLPNIT